MILTVTLNVAVDKRYVVEKLEPGTVMRVKEVSNTAGGKGLNVSKVAALCGEDVVATGFIGGHSGEYVVEMLGEAGIKSNFVRVKGESRDCINIYDEASGKQTEFLEPGITVTEESVTEFLGKFQELIKTASVVTISGSVPKGLDAKIYEKLINAAKSRGVPVLLDTSGELLKNGIKANPTLIKPNTDEIKVLTNSDIPDMEGLISCAAALHKNGISYVVVSLGRDGALLVCKDGFFKGFTPDIPVVNTVGCGDSMIAAFAVGLCRDYPTEKTFKLAMAVSTANALRTETGFFIQEDLDNILTQIDIKKIDKRGNVL